jgi:hypothetical protein
MLYTRFRTPSISITISLTSPVFAYPLLLLPVCLPVCRPSHPAQKPRSTLPYNTQPPLLPHRARPSQIHLSAPSRRSMRPLACEPRTLHSGLRTRTAGAGADTYLAAACSLQPAADRYPQKGREGKGRDGTGRGVVGTATMPLMPLPLPLPVHSHAQSGER